MPIARSAASVARRSLPRSLAGCKEEGREAKPHRHCNPWSRAAQGAWNPAALGAKSFLSVPAQAPTRAKEAPHRRPRRMRGHAMGFFLGGSAPECAPEGALHPGVPAPLPPLQTRYPPPQARGPGAWAVAAGPLLGRYCATVGTQTLKSKPSSLNRASTILYWYV